MVNNVVPSNKTYGILPCPDYAVVDPNEVDQDNGTDGHMAGLPSLVLDSTTGAVTLRPEPIFNSTLVPYTYAWTLNKPGEAVSDPTTWDGYGNGSAPSDTSSPLSFLTWVDPFYTKKAMTVVNNKITSQNWPLAVESTPSAHLRPTYQYNTNYLPFSHDQQGWPLTVLEFNVDWTDKSNIEIKLFLFK